MLNVVTFKVPWHQRLEDRSVWQPPFRHILGPSGCRICFLPYGDETSRRCIVRCLARYVQYRRLAPQLDHSLGRGISPSDIVCRLFHSLRNVSRNLSSVMGVFPMIMNIVQFWLIDSIVKASTSSTPVRSASPRNSDSQDREPLFSSPDDDNDVLPRDIEDGPLSSTSRMTSEGDFKTLVGSEDNKSKLSASGSSSPMTFPRTPVVVAHDYPPNTVGSGSSQHSARSRHQYKQAPSSLLDFPITFSAPAVSTLDSSRHALLSRSLDSGEATTDHVAEFEAWEKDHWEERAGGEGKSGRRSIHIGVR